MHFLSTLIIAVSALATAVSAANFSVIVGKDNLNIYEPNQLTGVQSGDFVSFKFVTKNHTVTQSTFAEPCVAKPAGVNSGYIPVDTTAAVQPEWTIQIDNVTAPLWFFCQQGPHCKLGMVFAINPTAERTFDTFLSTAKGETTTTTTTPATGGTPGNTGTGGVTTVGSGTTSGTAAAGTSDAPVTPSSGALGLSARGMGSLVAVVGAVVAFVL